MIQIQIKIRTNVVKNPNIIVGDYTYYDDVNSKGEDFEDHVTHFYPHLGDKLIIGKFCSIAKGVEFVMNGANHPMNGISAYPFGIFIEDQPTIPKESIPFKGDTVIGNDVWIGQNVTILPGVKIGDGAIIGTNSTVAKDIPPYSIAAGNPAKVIKKRFNRKTIKRLLALRWWDLPIEVIQDNYELLHSKDIEQFLSKLNK